MNAFAPLPHHPLMPGTRCLVAPSVVPAPAPPELVHPEDPAPAVMTDFAHVPVVTTTVGQRIDDALEHMKTAGVRLLMVTGDGDDVVGLISSRDIEGERPVKVVEEQRLHRAEVTVGMVMTPQRDIEVMDWFAVSNASVGDVLATLHALERQHALVAEIDPVTSRQALRGLFSTSQIARQLHTVLGEEIPTAHSLAEVVARIA